MNSNYEKFKTHMRKIADLKYAASLLSWDQETYMPKAGAAFRGQQLATLAGLSHELFITDEFGELLHKLETEEGLSFVERKNVELTKKDFLRSKKYSEAFVIKAAQLTSASFNAWSNARAENNFKKFAPYLKQLVELKKEEATLLGYKESPYDALLDQFEPELTTAQLNVLFTDVRAQLVDFVKQISEKPELDNSFLFKHFDKQKQWNFSIDMLKKMGYDFNAGRQDYSPHPFTTSFSMQDVRVTTRGYENDLRPLLWGSLHEGGHALYEQGMPADEYGLPGSEAVSLGIHESQSRAWENLVGRSRSYWKANYNQLQNLFPENLKAITLDQFYKGINKVKPSFIRVEADELTYHFHIMIRFEIEKGLMEGEFEVDDLPQLWKEKYKSYLGIDVVDDANGVLQDIHWSHGSFGYFPTYSLGSFYAVQFFNKACEEIPNLISEMEQGNTSHLLLWLREKIHRHGRIFSAAELCKQITGEELNFKYFMQYARKKYSEIYDL